MCIAWYKDCVFFNKGVGQNKCVMIVKFTLLTEPLQERGPVADRSSQSP